MPEAFAANLVRVITEHDGATEVDPARFSWPQAMAQGDVQRDDPGTRSRWSRSQCSFDQKTSPGLGYRLLCWRQAGPVAEPFRAKIPIDLHGYLFREPGNSISSFS